MAMKSLRLLCISALFLVLVFGQVLGQEWFWNGERRAAVVAVQVFESAKDPKPRETFTGFFVSRDGYFITAAHLVDGAGRVQFSLDGLGGPWEDFNPFGARLLGSDLALLKAQERSTSFPLLPMGCPEMVRREAQLHFAGFPFGRGFDTRQTEVSSSFGLGVGPQLDGRVAGAFSGGPVLDDKGRLVGAISAGVIPTPGFLQAVSLSSVRSNLSDVGVFVPTPGECGKSYKPEVFTAESSWAPPGWDKENFCFDELRQKRTDRPDLTIEIYEMIRNQRPAGPTSLEVRYYCMLKGTPKEPQP